MNFLIPTFVTRPGQPAWVRALAPWIVLAAALTAAHAQQAPLKVINIRFWSLGDTTRVAIETNGDFRYRLDRLENPDRLFFDLLGVKPAAGNRKIHSIPVGDGVLKQIRVAETQPGITRVVLDLDCAVEYKASQLSSPERLLVEVRRLGAGPEPTASRSQTGGERLAETAAPPPSRQSGGRRLELPPPPVAKAPVELPAPPPMAAEEVLAPGPESAGLSTAPVPVDRATAEAATPTASAKLKTPPSRAGMTAAPARQNRGGGRSLTRALGLKVGRVVLDAGHGGHDTGTIGPGGVLEKDLALDIALRLGQLIQAHMGSEVVYTRKDDTFVPLEVRTRIANEKQADLFLSIHINSSPYRAASGSETYYLNFTTSRVALEVAARENATSNKSIHELQDLIQKIALRDKVEESREFASRIQSSMYVLSAKAVAGKNRGVKKAPFVVLIGAAMPSVLTEVGFLTNPREGILLKRADQRQKIAEALYRGISSYASTLSHFQVARSVGE